MLNEVLTVEDFVVRNDRNLNYRPFRLVILKIWFLNPTGLDFLNWY